MQGGGEGEGGWAYHIRDRQRPGNSGVIFSERETVMFSKRETGRHSLWAGGITVRCPLKAALGGHADAIEGL